MSALQVAEHIARCLDEDGLDYAIGGALALTVHALPRDTADVDISAEDLCVTKLWFARPKDVADLEHVFAAHPELDVEYVRSWLVQLAAPGDRRFSLLDDLQRRFSKR